MILYGHSSQGPVKSATGIGGNGVVVEYDNRLAAPSDATSSQEAHCGTELRDKQKLFNERNTYI
jgi:hypothetical protein